MAAVNLYSFANADNLKKIQPSILRELLSTFKDFFQHKGFSVEDNDFNYSELANILMRPSDAMPVKLKDDPIYWDSQLKLYGTLFRVYIGK